MSPSKRAFEKYKPRGLFSEFYGTKLTPGPSVGMGVFSGNGFIYKYDV